MDGQKQIVGSPRPLLARQGSIRQQSMEILCNPFSQFDPASVEKLALFLQYPVEAIEEFTNYVITWVFSMNHASLG